MKDVAVIGAGYWGKNLVRNMAALGRLGVICDTSAAVRERMEQLHRGEVDVMADAEAVLARDDIDAVMVATPAASHYALVRRALLAGKHTYVEKPLTLDVGDAEALCRLADERGLKLMVGHLLLYHPCVRWLKECVDSGELGELFYLSSVRVNLGKVRADENAMWSLAPHDVSVALYLLGQLPSRVAAQGLCYLQTEAGIEDVVFATLRFADGRAAQLHVSWLDPHKQRQLTLVGSRKMLTFDDMEPSEKIRVYDKGVDRLEHPDEAPTYGSYGDLLTLRQGDISIPHVAMREPLRTLCEHFLEVIDTGIEPLSDGWNGVAVLRVLDAAQASLKAGGAPVALDSEVRS